MKYVSVKRVRISVALFCLACLFLLNCNSSHSQANKTAKTKLEWSHIQQSDREYIVTTFHAPADTVLLRYECVPDTTYIEYRPRALHNGEVSDTSYIYCPQKIKITAQTDGGTYTQLVPVGVIRKIENDKP